MFRKKNLIAGIFLQELNFLIEILEFIFINIKIIPVMSYVFSSHKKKIIKT